MRILVLLTCLGALGVGQAQPSTSYSPEFDARERNRIEVERQQALRLYGQEEADCYQRFAVNDCLRQVYKRRRVTLEELRRQEIALNDERRAAAAAAQQQRIDERAAGRPAAPVSAPAPTSVSVPAAGEGAAEAARRRELQRAYDEKQRRALQRREERRREQLQQGPRDSRPLPVPP